MVQAYSHTYLRPISPSRNLAEEAHTVITDRKSVEPPARHLPIAAQAGMRPWSSSQPGARYGDTCRSSVFAHPQRSCLGRRNVRGLYVPAPGGRRARTAAALTAVAGVLP